MHRFWVTKRPTAYSTEQSDEPDQAPPVSPAQLKVISEITAVLRTIIMRCWEAMASSKAHPEESPFQLFEMHADIAFLLGLDEGCWVMLELSGQLPTVIFEDSDLALLKRKSASELEQAVSALHHQLGNPTAFALLTRQ